MILNQILPITEYLVNVVLEETCPISQVAYDQWAIFRDGEYIRVIKAVQEHVYQVPAESCARKFICLQQNELSKLADRLFYFLRQQEKQAPSTIEPSPLRRTMAQEGLDLTCRLLKFLQHDFPSYFQYHVQAPYACLEWYGTVLAGLKGLLEPMEMAGAEVGELFSILREYLDSFQAHHPPLQRNTWQDYFYLEILARGVSDAIREGKEKQGSVYRLTMGQLFFLNFNHPKFYAFCVRRVKDRTEASQSFREQRRELLYLLKLCRQSPEKMGCGFDLQANPLKESMSRYIEEEIRYAEQVEKLHAEPWINGKEREPYPFYFQVSLTASQLAFFIRLMVETGLILTKRKADLHEFIANHIGTLKKESLSEHSLKNKSYNPSSHAARKVKAQLHLMLQLLNKKYL